MSRHYSKRIPAGLTTPAWPNIEDYYVDEFGKGYYIDEFGRIAPEVYEAAGTLWYQAQGYALMMLRDEARGQRLLLKATALVSRIHIEQENKIEDLQAYLFQTFKHLVLAELQKEQRRRLRVAEMGECLKLRSDDDFIDYINTKILIEQIVKRMDKWTHDVFELLVLEHTFEEIGQRYNKSGHVMRTKFRKQIIKIMQKIKAEVHTLEEKNAALSST